MTQASDHRRRLQCLVSCVLCASCAPAQHGPSPAFEPAAVVPTASSAPARKAFDASRIPDGHGFWCVTRPRVQTEGTTSHPYERCLRTQEECEARRTERVDEAGDEAHQAALRAATPACTRQPRSWCTTRGPEDVTKIACTGGGDCGKSSPLWFCTVTKQACTTLVDHLKSLLLFSACEETS